MRRIWEAAKTMVELGLSVILIDWWTTVHDLAKPTHCGWGVQVFSTFITKWHAKPHHTHLALCWMPPKVCPWKCGGGGGAVQDTTNMWMIRQGMRWATSISNKIIYMPPHILRICRPSTYNNKKPLLVLWWKFAADMCANCIGVCTWLTWPTGILLWILSAMGQWGRQRQCRGYLTYCQGISGRVANGWVWIPQIGVRDITFYVGSFPALAMVRFKLGMWTLQIFCSWNRKMLSSNLDIYGLGM